MRDDTSIGGSNVRFLSTAWSIVLEAKEGSRPALDQLIESYWKPVYFFVRRRGHDVEAAKDLTQSFFAVLLEREFLDRVSADRGRFRSFILACLSNFLSNERDRGRALKRGGGFDFVQAEIEMAAADPTPEQAFQREWARQVMARAMDRLRRRVTEEEMRLLSGDAPPGMPVDEKKQRTRKLRAQLRECLREEILPSVERDGEVESEIRELLAVLG